MSVFWVKKQKTENRRAEQVLLLVSGRERMWGEGSESEYNVNMCTHICKWKTETCWNYSRKGERGEWWRGWVVKAFINITMYSQPNNNNKDSEKRIALFCDPLLCSCDSLLWWVHIVFTPVFSDSLCVASGFRHFSVTISKGLFTHKSEFCFQCVSTASETHL
jgi:hypothetical protein